MKFGSALASENKENEIVSIPGLRGREPKEISVKNLAHIIQARMEEIIENIYYEIKNSGYEKKLIAGIVVTGGGAQLKHIGQLVEYMTGMDTRIGYPNEHLAKGPQDVTSPVFATGVGLVIKGLQVIDKQNANKPKIVEQPKAAEEKTEEEIEMEKRTAIAEHSSKQKGSFFDKILQKGKQFFEEDAE
jgi:cell division protein FtsA